MTSSTDNIRVGSVTLVYSVTPRGVVIKNPLKAQRLAEELNSRKVAA